MRWAAFACSAVSKTVSKRAWESSLSTLAMALPHVDVERVRKGMLDTTDTVHLNSAGDSPMPRAVLDRVTSHLQMEATVGGYEAGARCAEELEAVYESAAQLINARPDEIALQVCQWNTARCTINSLPTLWYLRMEIAMSEFSATAAVN